VTVVPAHPPHRLAELLHRHRRAVGLSQRELARRCGMSERAVRDLERGATARPRRRTLLALADALHLADEDRSAFVAPERAAPAAVVVVERPGELVGRSRELATLADLVMGGRHRIVTVTGPGGIGKSRLVAELVDDLRRRGLDVRTLDLSAIDDPALVCDLIAETFDAGGESWVSGLERVVAELRDRRAVLVLDGFERLLSAATEVAALVRRCPRLSVVLTSQRPARLTGERLLRLGPLPVPAAVELFARRAAAVVPGFRLTPAVEPVLAAICRRLDNLPLAVELAAAQLRLLAPAELAGRLDQPLRLLAGGAVDAPPRHRSLRATIEASLTGATDDGRTLFAWLAAAPAGVGLDDLEAIAGIAGMPPDRLLGALTDLVDAGLVQVRARRGHSAFVLLDAMRELAGERLADRGDADAVHRAAAVRFLHRLATAEAPNVRAALAWLRANEPGLVDRDVAESLYRYYELRGRLTEGRRELVALADAGAPAAGWALLRAAQLSQLAGHSDDAERQATQAQRRLDPDDHQAQATAWLLAGRLAAGRGDLTMSAERTTLALRAGRAAGDHTLVGRALNNLAAAAVTGGDLRAALPLMQESLAVKERAGADEVDLGRTMMNIGELLLGIDDGHGAAAYARRAAELLERGEHPRLRAMALSVLALAQLAAGEVAAASLSASAAGDLLEHFGDDHALHGAIQARGSLVQHATGDLPAAVATLRTGLTAMIGGHTRDEIAPIIEAHAALRAPADRIAAARLIGLARAVRDNSEVNQPPGPWPPGRTLAECRRGIGAAELEGHLAYGAARYPLGVATAAGLLLQERR
jgi:predicted ATPase/DNA-binding XRE family transcriptional regulator